MRRLAQDLGVAPRALYHHVPSKQELLTPVAERILTDPTVTISSNDPAQAAYDLRHALLRVRDSADVISFVRAFKPHSLTALHQPSQLLAGQLGRLVRSSLRW